MVFHWRRRFTQRVRSTRKSSALRIEQFEERLLLDGTVPTLTLLESSVNPARFGQEVTLLAMVVPEEGVGEPPTGTVLFRNGEENLAVVDLKDGVATLARSDFSVGTHFITALYNGDATYDQSTSDVFGQVVDPAATQTTVVSSQNPARAGQEIVFTATVTVEAPGGGVPMGTVVFLAGGDELGTAELDEGGSASFAASFGVAQSYAITAQYLGTDDHEGSTSSALSQVITRANTFTILESSHVEAVFGETVTLTVRVSAVDSGDLVPTGTVSFFAGGIFINAVELDEDGVAILEAATIPSGAFNLTARYLGDGGFLGSTSDLIPIRVSRAATSIAVEATPNPAAFGDRILFHILVTADEPSFAVPNGFVVLLNGGTVIATAQLQDGVISIPVASLFVGRHRITARYEGSADFQISITEELEVVVGTLNQRWVVQAFRHLLRRDPDFGGLTTFTNLLNGGLTHEQAATRIMFECAGSPVRCEYFELTVRDLYQTLLRRSADPGGLNAFVQYLRGGGTVDVVKAQLLGSPEYFTNPVFGGGGNNTGYIRAVFRDLYNRAPDTAEINFWLQVLGGGATREQAALAIVRSYESAARIGNSYFVRLLGRQASDEELAEIIEALQGGRREESIIAEIAGSFEYLSQV